MGKLDCFKAKARDLARSGYFYGLPPLEFELSFEEGFDEAREWLDQPSTKEELERLCQSLERSIKRHDRSLRAINCKVLSIHLCSGVQSIAKIMLSHRCANLGTGRNINSPNPRRRSARRFHRAFH